MVKRSTFIMAGIAVVAILVLAFSGALFETTPAYTITASFTYATSGMAVSLDVGARGGAPPYTFLIDWGDGTNVTNTDGTESHAYAADGTYTITMAVTDANKRTSVLTSATLTFSGGKCTANCGGSAAGISIRLIVQIVLVAVGALVTVIALFTRRLLLIILGAGLIVFGAILPYAGVI